MEPDKKLPSSTDRQMYQLHKKGYEDLVKAIEKTQQMELKGVDTVSIKGKDFKYEDFTEEQLKNLVPKKGKDYFTQEEQQSFVEQVLAKVPKPQDGKDAIVDYDKLETFVKKEVAKIPRPKDGADGKDAVVDIDSIVKKVLSKIPKQKEIVVDYDKVQSFVDSKIKDLNIEERLHLGRLTNSAGPRTRLGEMHDVDLSGLQTDQYLKWNGKKWVAATISGSGAVDSVNSQTGVVVLDADDIDDTSTTQKFVTAGDLTKLSNLSGTNTGDQTSIVGITGTKAQFDTAVTDGNFLYVGDVTSNATHTGDVTGATALTLDKTAITGKTVVTALGADYVLISDTSDSGNLKKALASDLMGAGSVAWGGITGTLSNQTDLQTELARIEALSVALAVAL